MATVGRMAGRRACQTPPARGGLEEMHAYPTSLAESRSRGGKLVERSKKTYSSPTRGLFRPHELGAVPVPPIPLIASIKRSPALSPMDRHPAPPELSRVQD